VTTENGQLGEENLFQRNVEMLSGNVTLSEETIEYDEPEVQINENGLVGKETYYKLPTDLQEQQEIKQEQQEIKQERQSTPEIEVLFWLKYFAFTFN